MKKNTPSLEILLHRELLAPLTEKANSLSRLNIILEMYLEPELRPLCKVGSLNQGTLTLITSNSTAAARLRYLTRLYLQQLRQHAELSHIDRIRVIVGNAPAAPSSRPPALRPMTEQASQTLKEAAGAIDDPELSLALSKLARHGKQRD